VAAPDIDGAEPGEAIERRGDVMARARSSNAISVLFVAVDAREKEPFWWGSAGTTDIAAGLLGLGTRTENKQSVKIGEGSYRDRRVTASNARRVSVARERFDGREEAGRATPRVATIRFSERPGEAMCERHLAAGRARDRPWRCLDEEPGRPPESEGDGVPTTIAAPGGEGGSAPHRRHALLDAEQAARGRTNPRGQIDEEADGVASARSLAHDRRRRAPGRPW
jgi:hypothetical protein